MASKPFFADFQCILKDFKNIYREEVDDLSVKSFTCRHSGLISYLKTVLDILNIKAKKLLSFFWFNLFQGQIII